MGPGLWTKQGHFIVLWDIENGIAHINDPASTSQPRTENSYEYMASQCKQYFCFNKPLPKEEPTQEVSIMALDKSSSETLSIIFFKAENSVFINIFVISFIFISNLKSGLSLP